MQLIITEKRSVGEVVARVVGAGTRRDGYYEGNGWLVSWCRGHLVKLAYADAYDPRYSKWNAADLPIVPNEWLYQVPSDCRKQFDILSALMARPDVDAVLNFCDAGREGEAIFRLVYHQAGCRKPVKRVWVSSLEETAVRKGLENVADGSEYDRLRDAAMCRQKADWLMGVNGTRLFSTLYGGKTLKVGRVKTPTLALLVDREAAISGFKKQKFYTVELDFGDFRAVSDKFLSRTDAEKLRSGCLGGTAVVRTADTKEKTERPPKLYDLTALQREANRLCDYTAQQTLDYLQSLYVKGFATYPRTDSRYLTDDMVPKLPDLCRTVSEVLPYARDQPLTVHAEQVADSSKVSDHHAVIPTPEIAKADLDSLPTGERNILCLISARLLCAVGDPHIYEETAVTLECGGAFFAAKGRTERQTGWKAVQGAFLTGMKKKPDTAQSPPSLPKLETGQSVSVSGAAVRQGTTSPPDHYTEDTLLSAMERASAEDFAEIENLERAGLGTPATRASIIEELINDGYAERKKKQILPTTLGTEMIRVIPDKLKSAKLTAEWERKLSEVERGMLDPASFLSGIVSMLDEMVQTCKSPSAPASATLSQSNRVVVGVCPRCGRNVIDGKSSFYCEGYYDKPPCKFAMWKNDFFFANKKKDLTKSVAAALLKHGRVHMTDLFSERKGVLYDADVLLDDTGEKVKYKLEFKKNDGKKGTKGE